MRSHAGMAKQTRGRRLALRVSLLPQLLGCLIVESYLITLKMAVEPDLVVYIT